MISFRHIETTDPLYPGELALRDAVLRAPQGRRRTQADIDRDREGFHFTAVEEGVVVGCLGLYPLSDCALEVRHVAVTPARQREGVASGLFRCAEEWALARNYRQFELDGRLTASGFYQACGFAAIGEEYVKHDLPHLKFQKALPK